MGYQPEFECSDEKCKTTFKSSADKMGQQVMHCPVCGAHAYKVTLLHDGVGGVERKLIPSGTG